MNWTIPVLTALACATIGLTGLPAQADYDRGVSSSDVRRAENRVHAATRILDDARQAFDHAQRARDGLSHELAGVQRELDALHARQHRDREARRAREALDEAQRQLDDTQRHARSVSREVDRLSRDADTAREAFLNQVRRDRDYEDAVQRLRYAERELEIAEERALRSLEQSYQWRAAMTLREDAALRLERVRQRYGVPQWTLQHAQRELDEAEARLDELRREAVERDYRVSSARRIAEQDQRTVDRLWQQLVRDLDHDPRYRRAVDRLQDAERDLARVEQDVEHAQNRVNHLVREVDSLGPVFVSAADVARLERQADQLSRDLRATENRIPVIRREVSSAEANLHNATRDYQRVLAAYNRGHNGDRIRDRSDRGNRYRR